MLDDFFSPIRFADIFCFSMGQLWAAKSLDARPNGEFLFYFWNFYAARCYGSSGEHVVDVCTYGGCPHDAVDHVDRFL